MKRLLPIFMLLLGIAALPAAAELTLDNVIDAHKAGVKPKILIQLIAAADTVSAVGPDEVARLRQEGVPEKVIAALKKHGRAQAAPKTDENAPDDPRMEQIVALVRAGLSQDLIIKQMRGDDVAYHPTTKDLIYLTNNNVPEVIVSAMIDSASGAGAIDTRAQPQTERPAPTAEEAKATSATAEESVEILTFGPLVRYRTTIGVTTDKRNGHVEIAGDTIRYIDVKKSKFNAEFFFKALKRVTLLCQEHPEGPVCYEIELKTVHGDEYQYRDTNWEAGGSEQIQALYDTLEDLFPTIEYRRKVK